MQDYDDGILSGKHKSLSSNILDTGLLASDREMTAKSVTSRAGEDLTHRLLLRVVHTMSNYTIIMNTIIMA